VAEVSLAKKEGTAI